MFNTIQSEALLKFVGSTVENHKGEILGLITEVTKNKDRTHIEYVILKSSTFFGPGERFFAVPASSVFIKIAENGKIILQLNKDDLQFAKGIAADQRPKPTFNSKQYIFELYRYNSPTDSSSKSGSN